MNIVSNESYFKLQNSNFSPFTHHITHWLSFVDIFEAARITKKSQFLKIRSHNNSYSSTQVIYFMQRFGTRLRGNGALSLMSSSSSLNSPSKKNHLHPCRPSFEATAGWSPGNATVPPPTWRRRQRRRRRRRRRDVRAISADVAPHRLPPKESVKIFHCTCADMVHLVFKVEITLVEM